MVIDGFDWSVAWFRVGKDLESVKRGGKTSSVS